MQVCPARVTSCAPTCHRLTSRQPWSVTVSVCGACHSQHRVHVAPYTTGQPGARGVQLHKCYCQVHRDSIRPDVWCSLQAVQDHRALCRPHNPQECSSPGVGVHVPGRWLCVSRLHSNWPQHDIHRGGAGRIRRHRVRAKAPCWFPPICCTSTLIALLAYSLAQQPPAVGSGQVCLQAGGTACQG